MLSGESLPALPCLQETGKGLQDMATHRQVAQEGTWADFCGSPRAGTNPGGLQAPALLSPVPAVDAQAAGAVPPADTWEGVIPAVDTRGRHSGQGRLLSVVTGLSSGRHLPLLCEPWSQG